MIMDATRLPSQVFVGVRSFLEGNFRSKVGKNGL